MDLNKLNELFEKANLSKKEMADMLGVKPQTIHGWGSTYNIPYWVETWLQNYIKAKEAEKIIKAIKNIEEN